MTVTIFTHFHWPFANRLWRNVHENILPFLWNRLSYWVKRSLYTHTRQKTSGILIICIHPPIWLVTSFLMVLFTIQSFSFEEAPFCLLCLCFWQDIWEIMVWPRSWWLTPLLYHLIKPPCFYLFVCLFVYWARVSLHSSGWPWTHLEQDQAGLQFWALPAFGPRVHHCACLVSDDPLDWGLWSACCCPLRGKAEGLFLRMMISSCSRAIPSSTSL